MRHRRGTSPADWLHYCRHLLRCRKEDLPSVRPEVRNLQRFPDKLSDMQSGRSLHSWLRLRKWLTLQRPSLRGPQSRRVEQLSNWHARNCFLSRPNQQRVLLRTLPANTVNLPRSRPSEDTRSLLFRRILAEHCGFHSRDNWRILPAM